MAAHLPVWVVHSIEKNVAQHDIKHITHITKRHHRRPTIAKLSLERLLLLVCASFPSLRVNEGGRALIFDGLLSF